MDAKLVGCRLCRDNTPLWGIVATQSAIELRELTGSWTAHAARSDARHVVVEAVGRREHLKCRLEYCFQVNLHQVDAIWRDAEQAGMLPAIPGPFDCNIDVGGAIFGEDRHQHQVLRQAQRLTDMLGRMFNDEGVYVAMLIS